VERRRARPRLRSLVPYPAARQSSAVSPPCAPSERNTVPIARHLQYTVSGYPVFCHSRSPRQPPACMAISAASSFVSIPPRPAFGRAERKRFQFRRNSSTSGITFPASSFDLDGADSISPPHQFSRTQHVSVRCGSLPTPPGDRYR